MKKKYQVPIISISLIRCENFLAAASVTVSPGDNNGYPLIIDEELQTSEKDWVFDVE